MTVEKKPLHATPNPLVEVNRVSLCVTKLTYMHGYLDGRLRQAQPLHTRALNYSMCTALGLSRLVDDGSEGSPLSRQAHARLSFCGFGPSGACALSTRDLAEEQPPKALCERPTR